MSTKTRFCDSSFWPGPANGILPGFATAIGGTGAAILPFAVGAAAQSHGVQVFNPFIIALLSTTTLIWLLLPRIKKTREA
jgi:nitrate/nitrite transporter NarK